MERLEKEETVRYTACRRHHGFGPD